MKHLLLGLAVILGSWTLGPTQDAEARGWRNGRSHAKRQQVRRYYFRKYRAKKAAKVPELDPSAAGSAMILLLGGAAYMLSRRRRDDELAY